MPREKSPTAAPARKRASPKPAVSSRKKSRPVTVFVDPEQRAALIAEAAYYRAQKRGFAAGNQTEDWLAAEAEVDAKLLRAVSTPRV